MNLAELRREYGLSTLDESEAADDPIYQFRAWLQQALAAQLPEPYAMTLATVDASGQPAARIVLLRHVDESGFCFFTNYLSRKGRELAHQPRAALLFFWPELERQVRVEGLVEPVSAAESDAYFASRPRGSQLAAHVSEQSAVIASRAELEQRLAELDQRFAGQPVPRPPHWGGYRLVPQQLEFWQGRQNRLHDRLRYRRNGTGWIRERLAP
jgi:pyridoxamine 5'-phosphate oxidase